MKKIVTYNCSFCNDLYTGKKLPDMYCQKCYKYFCKGGVIHELPPKGQIVKDENGYVICHICGKSFRKLGAHVKESHRMTMLEYKDQFDLYHSSKATEESYSNMMSQYAYQYGMPERLQEAGKDTRTQPGNKLRLGTGKSK